MKKVVVYGVRNLDIRRYIETFLDENYRITGYTDGHYTRDILDGKRFIALEALPEWEFDFILLCASSAAAQWEMRRTLQALGIPSEKVIRPLMLLGKGREKEHADLIADIERNCRPGWNLIFGLSYSAWGVLEKELSRPFYNCSCPSLDLYYNFRVLQYLEKRERLAPMETALLVIPYYYFDYDMSQSPAAYEDGRPFSIWRLDDWHHYRKVSGAWEYVENYRMFGEKTVRYYRVPKTNGDDWHVCSDPDGTSMLGPLWFTDHPGTLEENKALFVKFFRKVRDWNGRPVLIVPPLYLNGLNGLSKAAFLKKRETFYSVLKALEPETGTMDLYDFSERFRGRREWFLDKDHLNMAGAKAFTELINQEILNQAGIGRE